LAKRYLIPFKTILNQFRDKPARGLVLFYVWRKTENILIAILVHAAHNSLVILAPVIKTLLFGA
jgi:hypothetical protein